MLINIIFENYCSWIIGYIMAWNRLLARFFYLNCRFFEKREGVGPNRLTLRVFDKKGVIFINIIKIPV